MHNVKPRKFLLESTVGIGSQKLRSGEDMMPSTVRKRAR